MLQEASAHLQKILDPKYAPVDLNAVVQACRHLTEEEKSQLHALLFKYEHLFDGTLGTWNNEPYNIKLKERAQPYHSRPFPTPKIHERTLKVELDRHQFGSVKVNQCQQMGSTNFHHLKEGCNSEVHF